jgi:PhnB protein
MTETVQSLPEGYPTLIPYLSVRGGTDAIAFYVRAFGAQERYHLPGPDGKTIGHAELTIGDSLLMLADEMPEFGNKSPQTLGGSAVSFAIYVEDVDKAFARALAAGATELESVENKFYGDRAGTLEDPFGHRWSLMTHIEDVSPEEMEKRVNALYAGMEKPDQRDSA